MDQRALHSHLSPAWFHFYVNEMVNGSGLAPSAISTPVYHMRPVQLFQQFSKHNSPLVGIRIAVFVPNIDRWQGAGLTFCGAVQILSAYPANVMWCRCAGSVAL